MNSMQRCIPQSTLMISMLILTACSNVAGRPNQATLSAQLDRSQQLATRMSDEIQSTTHANELQHTATVQAMELLLQTARQWPVVLPGSFDQANKAWMTGEESNEYGSSKWTIMADKLRWEAQATQGMVWWSIPEMPPVSDFFLAVKYRQISGPPDSLAGLTFRVTDDEAGYYLFQLDGEGNFSVYQLEDNNWISLVPWQPAQGYQPGQQNEMAILGQGSHFYFFIKGVLVAEMDDGDLISGTAGLAIGLNNPGDEGTWDFEGFQVSAPTAPFATATQNP